MEVPETETEIQRDRDHGARNEIETQTDRDHGDRKGQRDRDGQRWNQMQSIRTENKQH